MVISEHEYNEMTSALTSALSCDSIRSKQYYIEQTLIRLVGPEKFYDIRDREGWEPGLPE